MSKITGFWKRTLRPAVLNALRYRTGVPVPRATVSAEAYAGDAGGTANRGRRFVTMSLSPSEPIPARTVSGALEHVEHTLTRIAHGGARADYLGQLQGAHASRAEEFVMVVDGGRVAHDSGAVITPDDRVLLGATGVVEQTDLPTNPLHLKYLPRATPVEGCLAVVTCSMPYNYYHWLMEALPRLAIYEQAALSIDRYYAPLNTRFQQETLDLLGIDRNRIERATRNRHVVAEQLAASSWDSPVARFKTDFLHRRLTSHLDGSKPPSLRIFVSRRNRGKRVLVNDNEIFAALTPLGFRRFDLETMAVADQIALFHKAECVVGPHGAGLTNIVFCRAGAKVLEINNPYRATSIFYAMAHYRKLDYHLHVADPVHDSFFHFDATKGFGDSNMRVRPAAFAALVRDFLEGKSMPSMPSMPNAIASRTAA